MYIPVAVYNMRKMQIQVLTRDGRKNIFETDRSRNVADLKKRIGRSLNVPMAFSRLTYKGRLLTNDSILEDEGVKRMSTLELYWQPLVLTPKHYREKELEMEKLDKKQRHVSRMADITVRKGGHERTPSGLRRPRDNLRAKRSLSADDMRLSTIVRNPEKKIDDVQDEDGDSSASSEDLDFLAAYWCYPKSSSKKSRKAQDPAGVQLVDAGMNMLRGPSNPEASCNLKETVSGTEFPCPNKLAPSEVDLLDDFLERRLKSKHQSFCAGLRLTAGRITCTGISSIREKQKKCKK